MQNIYLKLYNNFLNLKYILTFIKSFIYLISKIILLKNYNTFINIFISINFLFKKTISISILLISKSLIIILINKIYNIEYLSIFINIYL